MKIEKLKNGDIQITLENQKEKIRALINYYAYPETLLEEIKDLLYVIHSLKGNHHIEQDTPHIGVLLNRYRANNGDDNRVLAYTKLAELLELEKELDLL